jgi:predicted PurR-regulated permease PerM
MDQLNHPDHAPPAREALHPKPRPVRVDRTTRNLVAGVFILLLIGFLYLAAAVLLPVALAFLFALVLGPVVRRHKRHGIPAPATAFGLVVVLFIAFAAGAYLLSGPVATLISEAPRIQGEVEAKFSMLQKPLQMLSNASSQLQRLTAGDDGGAERVVVEGPSQIGAIASGAGHTFAQIGLCLVLLLFMLAAGDLFSEKLVKVLPTLSDKKRALHIAREIEHEVSRYLATISLINAGFGVVIGLGFWAVGMPSPVLWGVLAALLNFIPYVGATIGVIVTFAIALVAFDTLGHALLVPVLYILVAVAEGQVITPMIVGRRLEMNNVAILVSIAFWGWLWGIVGALIAVPILVTVKIFADQIDSMKPLGEFLGARSHPIGHHDVNHQSASGQAPNRIE